MNIVVSLDNSYSKITGLTSEHHKNLSKLMSYSISTQAAYFSNRYRSRSVSLLGKNGDYPTGLNYIVDKYLYENKLPNVAKRDNRKVPERSSIDFCRLDKSIIPYPEQTKVVNAAVLARMGIISAVTAFGKSLVAAMLIEKLQARTLVVVPSLELKFELIEKFRQYFNLKSNFVQGDNIWIENVQALDYKEVLQGYDCVIIDEFHHSGSKTYRKLNKHSWKHIYHRFGITATPFRSDENERLLLESVLSKIVARVSYHDAVKNKRIVPVEAYYIELDKVKTEAYTWVEVYSELVVNNKSRNETILRLLEALKGKSTLCLVKEIAHGKNLAPYPFMSGQDQESRYYKELFNRQEITELVGTTGVIGEGCDTKPAEYIIIAGLGKSKSQIMQLIGRGLRCYKDKESCKVILFLDKSHKFTLRHFKQQAKILKEEYGVVPQRIYI